MDYPKTEANMYTRLLGEEFLDLATEAPPLANAPLDEANEWQGLAGGATSAPYVEEAANPRAGTGAKTYANDHQVLLGVEVETLV
jgi:hypothetical protein